MLSDVPEHSRLFSLRGGCWFWLSQGLSLCFLSAFSTIKMAALGLPEGVPKIRYSPCWICWHESRGLVTQQQCRKYTDVRGYRKMLLERPWKAHV
ncbi:hypothetical protein COCC4DRAFT_151369 [Bipolaris maydis ATCC 48331]|uniref:Uncharacterized protein n=2 Tax=Cochliobolus heterostrophus TaxID=5016 RepID=M2UBJ5_COCH5|nr:uncharacterized protein COCC4DRAFT_151369 [Bipolaris maydis ATCC 48331]EMD85353.1 hypothetical protein COCHEDRAFT_1188347 [Bipolaris maydis C5]ENI00187.1 hypothetical protein COCC4DRAFT_151369 [Bipolaris maydis ATCC 48331]KAJ6207314.1 hypothetical protein PSV09DRAFT_1188347 [Bipolaris maydis]